MEFSLISRIRNPSLLELPSSSTTTSSSSSTTTFLVQNLSDLNKQRRNLSLNGIRVSVPCIRATSKESSNEVGGVGGFSSSKMEVTTFNDGFSDSDFPGWEKLGAVVRLSYGIGIYGAMALAGRFICSISGIDSMGGFDPSLDAILEGLGYATPPIMALLFILDDEVVKLSPYARAIRDVEDEELRSFFYGMSPWQFILVVLASSIGEELFYRAAVQGALADIFLSSTELMKDTRGIASLVILNSYSAFVQRWNRKWLTIVIIFEIAKTGLLPPFVPFAQAFAAVITAALTGSLYYVAASPKDPIYVVAPILPSRSSRNDLKKLFAAWYERRQMKKIYSPLLEGILALYLGFEWIQTNNILSPIITHGIYSTVILGHGLYKIHDHKRRLRQRIQQLKSEGKFSNKF